MAHDKVNLTVLNGSLHQTVCVLTGFLPLWFACMCFDGDSSPPYFKYSASGSAQRSGDACSLYIGHAPLLLLNTESPPGQKQTKGTITEHTVVSIVAKWLFVAAASHHCKPVMLNIAPSFLFPVSFKLECACRSRCAVVSILSSQLVIYQCLQVFTGYFPTQTEASGGAA